MRLILQLVIHADHEHEPMVQEVAVLEKKQAARIERLGLT